MKVFIFVFIVGMSSTAFSHGGGLNSSGCHNQKGGSYHCHRSPSSSLGTPFLSSGTSSENKRSSSARNTFRRNNPCPATGRTTGACPGYHVDHKTPLACGGADADYNMQWLTAEQNLRKGSMGCRN